MTNLEQFLGGAEISPPSGEQRLIWPDRIKHLSASALGMFRRCPEQFRHRYILGEKEKPGEALVIGSIFHEALEFNWEQKVSSFVDRPLGEVVEYLGDVAVPKVLEEDGGVDNIAWDSGDPRKGELVARNDSERLTAAYYKQVVPRLQPLTVESKFAVEDERLPVPLIGYIDLQVGAMNDKDDLVPDRVIDQKTGKQSASKMKPSWMLQSDIYCMATNLPVEYHSISRAKTPKITTGLESADLINYPNSVRFKNVMGTAAMMAEQIAWMYTRYGPDETWPTTGKFADFSMSFTPCQMCGWRKVCPAWEGEV
jgi:hypothetical protein